MGSGCGAVGRVVISNSRDPRFESKIYIYYLNCIEKTNVKKKEAGNGPFFKGLIKNSPRFAQFLIGRGVNLVLIHVLYIIII